jgi:hypothetical protein
MTRRRFTFWVGFGLFSLAEKLRADSLDRLAAAAMRRTEPLDKVKPNAKPEHWTATGNKTWRWYERETFADDQWVLTGRTTPIHRRTGKRYTEKTGYLEDNMVPESIPKKRVAKSKKNRETELLVETKFEPGDIDDARKKRHGRPPSTWLRSLDARELRIWMKMVEVPEVSVNRMTYWTHLTRDHSFDPLKIEGLTEDEQAKLHAAAHYGY